MGLDELIKKNAVIWFLGTLLTGFLGGFATYNQIFDHETGLLKEENHILEKNVAELQSSNSGLQNSRAESEKRVAACASQLDKHEEPNLFGVNINLTSPGDIDPNAGFISDLRKAGASVHLMPHDGNPSLAVNSVTYYNAEDKDHAKLIDAILKPIGVAGASYTETKGVNYIDVRVGSN